MTLWGHRVSAQFRLGLLTLAPIVLVAVLLALLPPDGNERAEWAQFIGRFHPLAVHFPIAFILLVPILELAGLSSRFSYLRSSAGFVLGLATLSATAAAILGWCLGRSGGYSGPLVIQHMWGGISLAAVCWACWIVRARSSERGSGLIYGVVLAAGVGLVAWTGYRGGQLSLGEDHLTEHMPGRLRHALGLSKGATTANAGPSTFYGARVEPIFEVRCVTCHGPSKHKANLRLDSYRGVMHGGKNGPVIRAGNVQGRIDPAGNIFEGPREREYPMPPLRGTEEIDTAAVTKLRAEIASSVTQLQKQYPNILQYESRGSANLILNASILGPKFGDHDLEALAPLAEYITVADFSRTAITDRSATAIAAMKRLRVLRLMHTGITDQTVQGLGALDQLESLNVFDTPVTPAALPTIAKLPKLAHCYAGQTAIPTGITVPRALTSKIVF